MTALLAKLAEPLDDSRLAAALGVEVFGQALAVEVHEPDLAAHVAWLLGDLAGSARPPQRVLSLFGRGDEVTLVDGETVVRAGVPRAQVAGVLIWHLNQLGVENRSRAVIHAGCVAVGGGGLVLPGVSGTGKSTLVAALVTRGFSYLSDELVGYSPIDGRLWPHAVPVGLRPGSYRLFARLPRPPGAFDDPNRRHLPATALRSGSVSDAVWPAAVVFPRRQPGAPACLEPMSPTEALAELANHTNNLTHSAQRAFPALGHLAATVPAWRLSSADLGGACAVLEDLASSGRAR